AAGLTWTENPPADPGAASAGAPNGAGGASARENPTAPTTPTPPAQTTVHRLAVLTIPAKHSRTSAPERKKGQPRRTNRPTVASSANDAGSWPKLSAVSAALIKSGRPPSVR